jgi:hypothetical protein
MFIEKLNLTVDINQARKDLAQILNLTSWHNNQIGLVHRNPPEKDVWEDCTGSLYDKEKKIEVVPESVFTKLNEKTPDYIKIILGQLADAENIKLGRIRLMRLNPNQGLSVHRDNSIRYHLVLETNQYAYIAQGHGYSRATLRASCFHIPSDGHFYKVDTTNEHFVYNGGKTERIHLVICPRA